MSYLDVKILDPSVRFDHAGRSRRAGRGLNGRGPTSTSPPSRCSAGSPAWPGISTSPASGVHRARHRAVGVRRTVCLAPGRGAVRLSPGRLLSETLATSDTMTNRVDRLAARGLVERYPDPADRRGVIVRLTPEGQAAVDGAFAALLEAERLPRRPSGQRPQAAGRPPGEPSSRPSPRNGQGANDDLEALFVRAPWAAADHRATVADRPVARGTRARTPGRPSPATYPTVPDAAGPTCSRSPSRPPSPPWSARSVRASSAS